MIDDNTRFWIVSPNVSNNPELQPAWEQAIVAHKRVYLGYTVDHPTDGKNAGGKFAEEVEKGDIVLIAQGANKNKRLLFCGMVDSTAGVRTVPEVISEVKPEMINVEVQYRDLKYEIDTETLNQLGLDFAGGPDHISHGTSNQIPTLIELKRDKPGDAEIMRILGDKISEIMHGEDQPIPPQVLAKTAIDLLRSKHQIILQGAPGTGKTRLAQRVAYQIINGQSPSDDDDEWKAQLKELKQNEQNARYQFIQFHPAYSYEDFVRGMVAATTGDGKIKYEVQDKVLADIAKAAARADSSKEFVLIIDEINRANLPAVLGELIYALEYRGQAVEGMYEKDGDRAITLPENLLIIGTMNTADRSVGHIDYAIRRRFAFVDVPPDASVVPSGQATELFNSVKALFDQYLSSEFDRDDVLIGHSYFLGDDPGDDLAQALKYEIKPILREYAKDGVLTGTDNIKAEIEGLKC